MPADYRTLIETVYSDEPPAPEGPLRAAWDRLQDKQAKAAGEARLRILPDPDPEWSFCARVARLTFEENENSVAWVVAQTRLGEESIIVIPLTRDGEHARPWPDGEAASLDKPLSIRTQKAWLRRSIRLGHSEAVAALKPELDRLPRLFAESALLKECVPLWLTEGVTRLKGQRGTLQLTLDARLGLVIAKEGD